MKQRYKNRRGNSEIRVDSELTKYAKTIIDICEDNVLVCFPNSSPSGPSDVVYLKPVVEGSLRGVIGRKQWEEVLLPVLNRVKQYLGKFPVSGSVLEYRSVVIGESAYNEMSLGGLYSNQKASLLDLIEKMILQQAKTKGYNT